MFFVFIANLWYIFFESWIDTIKRHSLNRIRQYLVCFCYASKKISFLFRTILLLFVRMVFEYFFLVLTICFFLLKIKANFRFTLTLYKLTGFFNLMLSCFISKRFETKHFVMILFLFWWAKFV